MPKLDSLKTELSELFTERFCLWYSGGADSTLLLETLLEFKKPFGILCFDDGWTRLQKEVIKRPFIRHNLQLYSYPPQQLLLIGNNENLSLTASYPIDAFGNSAVLLRDLVHGERCLFDVNVKLGAAKAPIEFDIHIWGSRGDDKHFALRKVVKQKRWNVGQKTFIAPLFDWTRDEVTESLKTFGIEYQEPSDELNTGNINACHKCFFGKPVECPKTGKAIDPVEWSPTDNLKAFQHAFGE